MPGKTKRKYESENIKFAKRLKRPLELVVNTLKPEYTGDDILQAFKEYYPNEWKEICERYVVYAGKDQFLKYKKGKTRYNPLKPEEYFFSLGKVKYLLSEDGRERHKKNYNDQFRVENIEALKQNRKKRIEKKRRKIEEYMNLAS